MDHSMDAHLLKREVYEFSLPQELIAQKPSACRDSSKLMIVDRNSQDISIHSFREIQNILNPGDSLVLNNTKVIPAKLIGKRESGGRIEFLLFKQLEDSLSWEALARPAKKLHVGSKVTFANGMQATLIEKKEGGACVISFQTEKPMMEALDEVGMMPLPHYIHREEELASDKERYQTVYAKELGACAAPTAGLHFTKELLENLSLSGVSHSFVTLHVGLGTFRPVLADDIREHQMHSESFMVDAENAAILSKKSEGKRIAVGTTCCRVLESVADSNKQIPKGCGETDIFIYPGYQFKYVDHLLTNFHLPGSTLLMLVSAFSGYDLMMKAYRLAIKEKFRFFSYGDAMLIL